jgi:hypothetical protein
MHCGTGQHQLHVQLPGAVASGVGGAVDEHGPAAARDHAGAR